MIIDLSSLFFNANLKAGGGTPSWGTALGQGAEHKLTYPGAAEILVAMDYCYRPLSKNVTCRLGKGGRCYNATDSQSDDSAYEIIKAAVFDHVFVNTGDKNIAVEKPFALLVVKENKGDFHPGRRTLKYSDSIVVGDVKNSDFYDAVSKKLGGTGVCWFAYAIDAPEQNKLILSAVKVSDEKKTYLDSDKRKQEWLKLLPKQAQQDNSGSNSNIRQTPKTTASDPDQVIYYGVPGCGKSNKIDEMLKSVDEKNKIRVVFHPEYTNADFVGQILPNVDGGGVNYRFTPGPFSRILKRAYLHPDEQFYLVIEEINRGNAAAIFGDIFQLLDRLKGGETDDMGNGNVYSAGWSQYFVQNDDINTYLRRKVNEKGDDIHDVPGEDPKAHLEGSLSINGICFSSTTAIRLPPNLSIYATMNTSDQNVFTLDNAFQRRFDMELVRNEFDNDTANDAQKNADIAETGVSWGEFWEQINKKIGTTLKGLASTEDKRLGVWFVKNDYGKIDKKVFAEKVLKYLWDDVFKFKRKDVFANDVDSLEKLVSAFYEHGFSDKVFKGWPWPQETASEEPAEA